jgi:multidrug efflux pump subunit AcrB
VWIVRLALRRPYTFVVAAILTVILGTLAILRMPTDVLPEIDIPVATVIWSYNGPGGLTSRWALWQTRCDSDEAGCR